MKAITHNLGNYGESGPALSTFKNLVQLTQYFSSEEKCREYLRFIRWEDGEPVCEFCGHDRCYQFKGGKLFKCAKCKRRFSITRGTIFHSTKIPLRSWFIAIYLMTSHKKGISSLQLGRDLGVCQKSGWHLGHRIRKMMKSFVAFESSSVVEVDETYFGPKQENLHAWKNALLKRGPGQLNKTPIIGMYDRISRQIQLGEIPEVVGDTVTSFIFDHLPESSRLITDGHGSYVGMHKHYSHDIIYHSRKEYVVGDVHTNSIENFWSHFKRGIYGIYHHCSAKHLHRYGDAFAYRYNTMALDEEERFDNALIQGVGRRLKIKDLVAIAA